MLKVHSDATGRMEPCSVHTGVLGADGVRRGAMADIDCLLMAMDVVDDTPMENEGMSDKMLRRYNETHNPARVSRYTKPDTREQRVERLASIREEREAAGVSLFT